MDTRNAQEPTDEGFERGLALLLNRVYEEPTVRDEFRSGLLDALKDKQTQIQATRRQRRRTVIPLYSLAGLAAAAALCLAILPSLRSLWTEPQDTNGPTVAAATNDASVHATSSAEEGVGPTAPAATPIALARAESDGAATVHTTAAARDALEPLPLPHNAALAPASDTLANAETMERPALCLEGATVRAVDAVEYRCPERAAWKTVAAGKSFKLGPGTEVRAPADSRAAIKIGEEGPAIVLAGGGRIRREGDIVAVDRGVAVVSTQSARDGVELRVGGQSLRLAPGGMIFCEVPDASQFAAGGEPPAVVVPLKTGASSPSGDAMLAGNLYNLYATPTGKYPHRRLGPSEMRNFPEDIYDMPNMPKPRMVNFQYEY